MADCDDTVRELETFLDDELPDSVRSAIEHHLHDCLDCHHVYDLHAELRIVIAEKCHHDEMPPTLMGRLRDCLGRPGDPPLS